jgi:hypothetical protein
MGGGQCYAAGESANATADDNDVVGVHCAKRTGLR